MTKRNLALKPRLPTLLFALKIYQDELATASVILTPTEKKIIHRGIDGGMSLKVFRLQAEKILQMTPPSSPDFFPTKAFLQWAERRYPKLQSSF